MRLLEYEAKAILGKYGLPLPQGEVITNPYQPLTIPLPVVVKSQVPIGGRGKAGGVIIAEDETTYATTIIDLFQKQIRSFTPKSLLVEEKLTIAAEGYLSLIIDRDSSTIQLLAHPHGGVDVEIVDPTLLFRRSLVIEPNETLTREVLVAYGQTQASPATVAQLQTILVGLWQCLKDEDALLIEINPLIVTDKGQLVIGDCKMEVDDNAAFRHDWKFEATPRDQNFVVLNIDGEVATLANGAGLAMSTVDTVASAGLSVANFLDIGGGTNEETAIQALRTISSLPKVRAIIINIFAGITKSDEVARAVIAALDNFKNLPPLFIRIDGNKQDQARKILEARGIILYETLTDCVEAVAKELSI